MNYNFNIVCKDLGLDLRFEVDEDLYEEKNAWFKRKVFITGEMDFFDNAGGGYASDDEQVEIGDIEWN